MSEETIPQMRETIDRLAKDNKSLTIERDDAVAEVRSLNAKEFARLGKFTANAGELYAKNYEGELSAEGLVEFAAGLGLTAEKETTPPPGEEKPPEKTEEAGAEAPGSPDLSKMSGGGSTTEGGAGGVTEELMTREEWTELSRTDKVAAATALAQGKVKLLKDNPYAGNTQRPGNPWLEAQTAASE